MKNLYSHFTQGFQIKPVASGCVNIPPVNIFRKIIGSIKKLSDHSHAATSDLQPPTRKHSESPVYHCFHCDMLIKARAATVKSVNTLSSIRLCIIKVQNNLFD